MTIQNLLGKTLTKIDDASYGSPAQTAVGKFLQADDVPETTFLLCESAYARPKVGAAMTAEVRALFDIDVAAETDPEGRAKLELLREYFCNPDFRQRLSDFVWSQLNSEPKR